MIEVLLNSSKSQPHINYHKTQVSTYISFIILDFKHILLYTYLYLGSDTYTIVTTIMHIVSIWDPRLHYKP